MKPLIIFSIIPLSLYNLAFCSHFIIYINTIKNQFSVILVSAVCLGEYTSNHSIYKRELEIFLHTAGNECLDLINPRYWTSKKNINGFKMYFDKFI